MSDLSNERRRPPRCGSSRCIQSSAPPRERPIRDGDWAVMRLARGAAAAEVNGKVALLEVPDRSAGAAYQIKRVVRDGKGWMLRSDNPVHPSYEGTSEVVVIALLASVVRPEDIGPRPGEVLDEPAMSEAFGLSEPVRTGRIDGHPFFCVEEKGLLVAPDRLRIAAVAARPGETAYLVTRHPGGAEVAICGRGSVGVRDRTVGVPFGGFRDVPRSERAAAHRARSPRAQRNGRGPLWIDCCRRPARGASWRATGNSAVCSGRPKKGESASRESAATPHRGPCL